MAYISSLGNHYIENRWMPISYNTDLMAKAAAGMQKKFETNYMLAESIKSQYENISFLNTAADAQYKEKYSKVEEYFKGNPNIDYTDPLAIKNLMEVFKPLSQDTSLKSLYRREGEIKKQISLIEEMKAKKDAGYNATNEAVFNADLNDYINSGDLKEASNKITQIKYTPYKDINEATKYCSDLLKDKEVGSVRQSVVGVNVVEESSSEIGKERYNDCIQSSLNTPEYLPQLTINNRYEALSKGKETYIKDISKRYTDLIDNEISAYSKALKEAESDYRLAQDTPGSDPNKLKELETYKGSLSDRVKRLTEQKANFKIDDSNYLNIGVDLSIKEKAGYDSEFLGHGVKGFKITGMSPDAQFAIKTKGNSGESSGATTKWGEGVNVGTSTAFIEKEDGEVVIDDIGTLDKKAQEQIKNINPDYQNIFNEYYKTGSLTKENRDLIEKDINNQDILRNLDNIRNAKTALESSLVNQYDVNVAKTLSILKQRVEKLNNPAAKKELETIINSRSSETFKDPVKREAFQNKLDNFVLRNATSLSTEEASTTYTGSIWKGIKKAGSVLGDLTGLGPLAEGVSYIYNNTNPYDKAAFVLRTSAMMANERDENKEFEKFKNIVKDGGYELTLEYDKNRKINEKNIDNFTLQDYKKFKAENSKKAFSDPFTVNRSSEASKKVNKEKNELYTSLGLPALSSDLSGGLPSTGKGIITQVDQYEFFTNNEKQKTATDAFYNNEGQALANNYGIKRDDIQSIVYQPSTGLARVSLNGNVKDKIIKEYKDKTGTDIKESGNTLVVKISEPTYVTENYSNIFNYPGAQTLGTVNSPFNSKLITDPVTKKPLILGYVIKENKGMMDSTFEIMMYSKTPGETVFKAHEIKKGLSKISNQSLAEIKDFIQTSITNPEQSYLNLLNTPR